MMKIESVVLENRDILLEPLTMDHVDGLHEVAMNPELWLINNRGSKEQGGPCFLYLKST
jgi:hypothetical protein